MIYDQSSPVVLKSIMQFYNNVVIELEGPAALNHLKQRLFLKANSSFVLVREIQSGGIPGDEAWERAPARVNYAKHPQGYS